MLFEHNVRSVACGDHFLIKVTGAGSGTRAFT